MRIAPIATVVGLAALLPVVALAETDAERAARLTAEDKAFGREIRPVERRGCKEYWEDARTAKRITKACDRVISDPGDLTDRQRGYAYFVRGRTHAEQSNLSEAKADLDQAAALNPNYAPVYYERGYVHSRLEHSALSFADFQKSVDLGNKGAEYALKTTREACPSLTWEGKTCVASATAPAATTMTSASTAQRYTCPNRVSAPSSCTISVVGDPDLDYDCPPGVDLQPACKLVGPVPPPSVIAIDAPPAVPAEKKSGWFAWLWGSKTAKPAPAQPLATTAEAPPPLPAPTLTTAAPAPGPASSANAGQTAPIPPGCPIDESFGSWTIRRGTLDRTPVVTTRGGALYAGKSTTWSARDLSLELIPLKNGKWLYVLVVTELKHGGSPVTEISGSFGVTIWDSATKKDIIGFNQKDGHGNMFVAPHTIVVLPPWMIDDAVDKIEATANLNIALALPKEDGSGLIDIAWYSPFGSTGLRAAMTAAKPCAVN